MTDGTDADTVEDEPWDELIRLSDASDTTELTDFVSQLSVPDQALAFSRLDEQEAEQVLNALAPKDAAEVVARLPEAQAAQTIGSLEPETAAAIVHELRSDDQADVLGDLEEVQAEAILASLPDSEASVARELASYDDDVAGGLMARELLRFRDQMTVAEVIDQLSEQGRFEHGSIRYGYVCDKDGRLVGVLPMSTLIFEKRATPIDEVMVRNPLSVPDTMTLDDLIDVFETHKFLGVPVVDGEGRLIGVVDGEAVARAAIRVSDDTYLKSQGIVSGEELRSMPLSRSPAGDSAGAV